MQKQVKITLIYSQEDYKQVIDFKKHMYVFRSNKNLYLWDESEIVAGELWYETIFSKIEQSDFVLLYISKNFFWNDYLWDNHIEIIKQKEESNNVRIISIIGKPCDYKQDPFISKFKCLPRDGQPIHNNNKLVDRKYTEVVNDLKLIIIDGKDISSVNSIEVALKPKSKSNETLKRVLNYPVTRKSPIRVGTIFLFASLFLLVFIFPMPQISDIVSFYKLMDQGKATSNKKVALEKYKKAIEIYPSSVEAHFEAGCIYYLMNDRNSARREFLKTVKFHEEEMFGFGDDNAHKYYFKLGVTALDLYETNKDIKISDIILRLEQSLKKGHNPKEVYLQLSKAHEKANNIAEAIKFCEMALKEDKYYEDAMVQQKKLQGYTH